jgi:hypothetical protein
MAAGFDRRGHWGATAWLALCLAWSGHASADESPKILAERLFTEARALMTRGETGPACERLEESQRLDAAGGTALLLGICYQQLGKHASAWAALRSARAIATRDRRQDRIDVANEHLRQVEARLAYVTISLDPRVSVPELHVLLDGVDVGRVSRGEPIPVDPGAHTLRATLPDVVPFVRPFTIVDAPGATVLDIPQWTDEPAESPRAAPVEPPPAPSPPAREEPARAGSRVVPLAIAGGAGVIALGVMGYFGLHAISDEHDKPVGCFASDAACEARWHSLEQDRSTDTTVATIAGGAAIAAVAAAAIVLFWPKDSRSKDRAWTVAPLSRSGAGVTVSF